MKHLFLALAITLCAAIGVETFAGLRAGYWDWDLNNRLYFGDMLARGQLPLIVEKDDKLPIVHIIFAPAGAAKSVTVWVIHSLFVTILGGLATGFVATEVLRARNMAAGTSSLIGVVAALVSIWAMLTAPGGMHHFNAMTMGFFMIGVAGLRRSSTVQNSRVMLSGVAIVCLAIACGLRPYLVPVAACSIYWATTSQAQDMRQKFTALARPFVGMLVVAAVINVAPFFVLEDGFSTIYQATTNLYTDLNRTVLSYDEPVSSAFILRNLWLVFGVAMYVCIRLCTSGLTAQAIRATHRDAMLWILAPILILHLIFSILHFWDHYTQMYVPFLSIGVVWVLSLLLGLRYKRARISASIAIVGLMAIIVEITHNTIQKHSRQLDVYENITSAIGDFLETQPKDARDFLAIESMYAHWKLGETRKGFPHSSQFMRDIAPTRTGQRTVTSAHRTICERVNRTGPTLVFVFQHTDASECLRRISNYQKTTDLQAFAEDPNFVIEAYRRVIHKN